MSEIAGVELYYHLDWLQPQLELLHQRLAACLAAAAALRPDASADAPPVIWSQQLRALHDEAQKKLAQQADALAAEVQAVAASHGQGAPAALAALDNRQINVLFRQAFMPLDSAEIQQLFALPHMNTAAQRLKRYRDALPDMIPRLRLLYDEAADLADGADNSA